MYIYTRAREERFSVLFSPGLMCIKRVFFLSGKCEEEEEEESGKTNFSKERERERPFFLGKKIALIIIIQY